MQKWSSDLEVSSKFCLNRFETMNKDTSAFVVMINHNEASWLGQNSSFTW